MRTTITARRQAAAGIDRQTILAQRAAEQQAYLDRAMAGSHPYALQILANATTEIIPDEAQPLLAELRVRIATKQPVADLLEGLCGLIPWCFPDMRRRHQAAS